MEQYIKKSVLVAEINRVVNSYDPTNEITSGRYALVRLRNFLDTLEVKEVDLDKEIDLVEDKYHGFESLSRADIIDIAKHFFKLGLKVQKDSNDAFIKKACEFIEQNITGYIDVTHKGGDENITLQEDFIDEFKKYMIESD